MNLSLLPSGPAAHEEIIMSSAWSSPCAYNDSISSLVDAISSTPTSSFVRFQWVLDARTATASYLLLRVKLKAYVPPGASNDAYCQADVRAVVPGATSNHFIHVDEWLNRDPTNVGRRIPYATGYFPVVDGKVMLDVAHGIRSRGEIEFVAYLEGYVTP